MASRIVLMVFLCVQTAAAQSSEVHMTYLGNMGVVLESAGRIVVIDGLHHGELPEYTAVPDTLLAPLESARPPFAQVTIALTTHRHKDHFNALAVARRLSADSGILYGAPQEVIDSLRTRAPQLVGSSRLRALMPADGGRTPVIAGVTALGLPHNPTPSTLADNVGYLVELGGLRILHVGDADPSVARYQRLNLDAEDLDVAIVPFWYLAGASDALRRAIRPKIWVASHVPLEDADKVRQAIQARLPTALVLGRPGERYRLR